MLKNTYFAEILRILIEFNDSSSFDIYENDRNFVSILLYKNTGISLCRNTLINTKFNKNVLMIEIQNKDKEQTLKN